MPPKKKTKKDEDFKKAKLKVGKKKAPPSNKTDTSFKSKSILLPKQDLEEKNISGTELVSSRNQTLPELISLLRHHSAPIRKDAASGIEEIFQKDQDYVLQRLNVVVDATCHLFADEDRGVRSSGRSLASVLLSNASASKVRPFMPLIMAYTAAALTHITEDVRLDALKLMQIYATSIPTLIAPYANQILTNYVSILSSNSVSAAKGPSSGNKGPSLSVNPNSKLGLGLSRIEVLTSLLGFLEKILNKGMTTYWYFYERNETIETLLGNQLAIQRLWTDPLYNVLLNRPNEFIATVLHENDMESIYGFDANPATKLDVETPTSKKPGQERLNIKHISLDTSRSTDKMETAQTLDFNRSSAASSQTMREVADKLIPILIDFWIEAVAYISGVDSGASKSETFLTALEVCHLTLQLMLTVFRAMVASGQLREWAKADRAWGENLLNLLLKHVIVHFPLGGDSFYSHDSKVNYTYQRMNVTCCELLSYFMHSLRETGKGSDNLRLSKSMLRYLLTIFDKNAREQEVGKKRLNSIELKPEHLAATFPTVWILLNQLTAPDQLQLFDAIIRYHFQSGSTSATKKVLFHYVARIFMLRSSRQWRGGFVPSLNGSHPTDEHGEKFVKLHREFLASLPKWLWELRTSDIELGGAILRYQTQNLRENVFEVANDRIHMEHLQNALTPLFHVSIPNRGDIYGPFRDLPVGEQRGTLDLLFYFTSPWSTKLLSALVACFCRQHSHGISADVHLHLLTIVSERQNSLATALEVPLFVGFIMTLGIVGYTKDDLIVLRSAVGYGGAKAVSFQELHSIWEKSKSTAGKRKRPPKEAADEEEDAESAAIASFWQNRKLVVEMAIGALQSLCSRSNASSAVEGYDMNMGVELEQHLLKHVPLHGLHFVPIAIDALSKPLPVDSIYSISRMVMWLHTNLNSEQLVDLGSAIIVAIVDALLINISEPKSFGYCFEAIQELLLANKYMTTMVVKALVATVGQNMTPNDGNLSSEALSRTAGALRVVRQLILDNVPLANEVGSKPDSIADLRTLIQAWKSFASEETKHNALTDVTSIEKYLTRVSKNVS